ncbi:MAG: F0F1 ATP synthase subunit epsilon [Propionibacteriaceae bacterium]|jgi:F-type H+-transporting ATPase subunit epsilon|nr:F0F1 ATP synthase subunit epsilon [Propionibacteriaceae bacterium]
MAASFQVDVVAADRMVWTGQAVEIIAVTTDGEVGILAGHIPLIATLAPGSAEIMTDDGRREVVAVEGGFLSVGVDRTAIISPYAQLASELSVDQAQKDLREVQAAMDDGDNSIETLRRYHRATAQVKAATRNNHD